jgi:hypothetical protein
MVILSHLLYKPFHSNVNAKAVPYGTNRSSGKTKEFIEEIERLMMRRFLKAAWIGILSH